MIGLDKDFLVTWAMKKSKQRTGMGTADTHSTLSKSHALLKAV
jgi:formate-dependent nitrite reductase cytochrome c552 subunit